MLPINKSRAWIEFEYDRLVESGKHYASVDEAIIDLKIAIEAIRIVMRQAQETNNLKGLAHRAPVFAAICYKIIDTYTTCEDHRKATAPAVSIEKPKTKKKAAKALDIDEEGENA
jgi:hypothetical protein